MTSDHRIKLPYLEINLKGVRNNNIVAGEKSLSIVTFNRAVSYLVPNAS